METMLHNIQNRARSNAINFARPGDFTLDEGQPAAPRVLLDEPGWTPDCLDDENQRVLFVNTPPEVDLSQAAFVYAAQFEQARRALSVSYETLVKLAEDVKAPKTMILVYSMGRCGSTLMN